jgi:RimJ/RimL family protein N-acetyltransferase
MELPAFAPTPPVLFSSADVRVRTLGADDVPRLQVLFDRNPEYFRAVNGRHAAPDEAQTEFDERPPAHLSYRDRWFMGLFDRSDELVGHAGVLSDLMAPGIWHVGLLVLATRLHGRGVAVPFHAAMEAWMRAGGARWLRLGVVAGNARAERYWDKVGYREVRVRAGIDTGGRINDIRVLVKPLYGQPLAEYLELVPRDRPDSALP